MPKSLVNLVKMKLAKKVVEVFPEGGMLPFLAVPRP